MSTVSRTLPPQGLVVVDPKTGLINPVWYSYFLNFSSKTLINNGASGIITSDGTNLYGRTLTAGSNKISITNGAGATANPTVDVSQGNLVIGTTQLSGILQATTFPALTGDITTSSGAVATTLATVNSNVGSYTNANITVNAKGLITSASNGTASGGTVTSVTYTGDGVFQSSTPSSAVTTSGTVAASLLTQTQKTFLAGPTSGSAATPTFRTIAVADVPTLNQNTSGSSASCTGNAATVTTNANLTGNVTSVGNATTLVTGVTAATHSTGVAGIPSFSAYNSTIATMAAASFTLVPLQTKEFDVGNYFSTSTYKYTPLVAGIYAVQGMASINSANVVTTTQYNATLYKNGVAFRYGTFNASIAANVTSNFSTLVQMNGTTDYLQLYFFNGNAATTLNTNASQLVTYFSAVWLGPSS